MRIVQEAGLTDLESQMKQAKIASWHLIDIKIAIDSLLLKKQQDEGVKEIETESKVENVLYH